MEKEQVLQEIMDIKTKYYCEMCAEGAWCGHVYAPEYFHTLRDRMLKFIDECLEQYKDHSVFVSPLNLARFKLSDDYDALISRIYKLDWEDRENIHLIAEALNDKFKETFADAMSSLAEFYSLLSGRLFDEAFEEQQSGE